MKITERDYEWLSQGLSDVLVRASAEEIRAEIARLEADTRVKDARKAFRWNVYSVFSRMDRWRLQDILYSYCDDSHIDTALRRWERECLTPFIDQRK